MHSEGPTELLFAYGTLQQEAVQLATFGRKLEGKADAVCSYSLRMIHVADADFVAASGTANHRNLEFTGDPADVVEGTAFIVTSTELQQADAYEPTGYTRHLVQLRSGLTAWVYLSDHPTADLS